MGSQPNATTTTNTMKHQVFVYGTLRHGHHLHTMTMGSAKFIREDRLRNYNMFDVGSFPAIAHTDDPDCEVVGEVYEVNADTLARLDQVEGFDPTGTRYRNHYERVTRTTATGLTVEVYEYTDAGNLRPIHSGDFIEHEIRDILPNSASNAQVAARVASHAALRNEAMAEVK